MLEIEWKLKETVYRNLLNIKGISTTLASRICINLGISKKTLYEDLILNKKDNLNKFISFYRKTNLPFDFPNYENTYNLNKLSWVPTGPEDWMTTQVALVNSLNVDKKEWNSDIKFNPILNNVDEFKKEQILMLINLHTLRGKRFKLGYPVRGQRTRTNARTAKKLNRISY